MSDDAILLAAVRLNLFTETGSGPLFRSNAMRNILLTAFCKKYGVGYLRKILSPLMDTMAAHPHQSYEIDASRAPPGTRVDDNIEVVKTVTKAFLTVILNSVNAMPPSVSFRRLWRLIQMLFISMIREACAHLAYKV